MLNSCVGGVQPCCGAGSCAVQLPCWVGVASCSAMLWGRLLCWTVPRCASFRCVQERCGQALFRLRSGAVYTCPHYEFRVCKLCRSCSALSVGGRFAEQLCRSCSAMQRGLGGASGRVLGAVQHCCVGGRCAEQLCRIRSALLRGRPQC